jgi:hypothetical protein
VSVKQAWHKTLPKVPTCKDDPVGSTPQEKGKTHVVELEDIPEKTSREHDKQPRVDSLCNVIRHMRKFSVSCNQN